MKFLFMLLAFSISTPSFASFFQTNCSNAEGTTRWTQGHVENTLFLTKRSWEGGVRSEEVVKIPQWEIEYNAINEHEIHKEASSNCPANADWGIAKWRTLTWVQVELKRVNGIPFNTDFVGVNSEGSIQTYLICEQVGNSQTYCGPTPAP